MTHYAIDVVSNLLREELPTVTRESLPEIAPIYNSVIKSSMDVQSSGIGRGWKVEHTFDCGVAGMMQHANPDGYTFLTNTGTANRFPMVNMLDTTQSTAIFPNPLYTPHSATLKRVVKMHMSTGNFSLPATWFSTDALSANVLKQIAREIKAVSQYRALTEAQSFFMPSNNTLGQIDNINTTNAASGSFTFTVKEGSGRTSFFRPGMAIDILADSSGTPQFGADTNGTDRRNYSTAYYPLVIGDVDYLSGTIRVCSPASTDISGLSIANDDWIVLANCNTEVSTGVAREMKTYGIEDWMADKGQILGGSSTLTDETNPALDLDTYSQFKSKLVTVSGPLTDQVMNGYIGGFLDSYPGATIDTILTTMGVTLKYLENPSLFNNRMIYDRTSKPLSAYGGWDEVSYSFNGKILRWIISPMVINGRLYAFKLNNNLIRYEPPKVGGTNGQVGSEMEFLVPLAGGSSIFKLVHDSNGATAAMLEAPFYQYVLLIPLDVRGVKLSSLTEATMS
jgi:hypothetical protein